jgi:hypothetical protein
VQQTVEDVGNGAAVAVLDGHDAVSACEMSGATCVAERREREGRVGHGGGMVGGKGGEEGRKGGR